MKPRPCKSVAIRFATAFYCLFAVGGMTAAFGTPIFARETGLPCSSCHSQVPRLNEFGQRFYANRFQLQGNRKLTPTMPLWAAAAICPSGDTAIGRPTLGNKIDVGWQDNIIGSTGYFAPTQTLYHFIWAPVVHIEETYLTQPIGGHVALQAGNLALTSQTDPRLDLNVFQPEVLAPHGNGFGRYSPFAPDGVAVAVRAVVSTKNALPYANGTSVSVTAPLSNEVAGGGYNGIQIPYNFSKTPTGEYVEIYNRSGMDSSGVSGFFGADGRRYYGFFGQRQFGKYYVQGGGAYDQWPYGITRIASLGVDVRQSFSWIYGMRLDQQDGKTSIVPTLNLMADGHNSAPSMNVQEIVSHGSKPQTLVTILYRF